MALDRKFKITQNDINKSFDQLTKKNGQIQAVDRIFSKSFKYHYWNFRSTEKSKKIRSSDEILMSFIKTFDQVTKHNFDQTPILLENFDQVIRSSEIRSSDPLSI